MYKLQKETYYLAMDYTDRYLLFVVGDLEPPTLQLIGITALFIASKNEVHARISISSLCRDHLWIYSVNL